MKIYTNIFEHFINIHDFESIKIALNLFPHYMIDQDLLLDKMKKEIENDKELTHNTLVLDVLY